MNSNGVMMEKTRAAIAVIQGEIPVKCPMEIFSKTVRIVQITPGYGRKGEFLKDHIPSPQMQFQFLFYDYCSFSFLGCTWKTGTDLGTDFFDDIPSILGIKVSYRL
jgi:hypothetical protein